MKMKELFAIEREIEKNNLILNKNVYFVPHGTISKDGVVIAGYAGHFYILDGTNRWEQQVSGNMRLTQDGVGMWRRLLEDRVSKSRHLGLKIFHIVIPEKQIVLPQFRWEYYEESISDSRPFKTVEKIAPVEANVIYPESEMKKFQAECDLYWRGNSHWNVSGCLISSTHIIGRIFGENILDVDKVNISRKAVRHDLISRFSNDDLFEEALSIDFCGKFKSKNDMYRISKKHQGSNYVVENNASVSDEKVVIFGDSYSHDAGLGAVFSYVFREVHFIWSPIILWDYVEKSGAKNVVWQSAERYMAFVPQQ